MLRVLHIIHFNIPRHLGIIHSVLWKAARHVLLIFYRHGEIWRGFLFARTIQVNELIVVCIWVVSLTVIRSCDSVFISSTWVETGVRKGNEAQISEILGRWFREIPFGLDYAIVYLDRFKFCICPVLPFQGPFIIVMFSLQRFEFWTMIEIRFYVWGAIVKNTHVF